MNAPTASMPTRKIGNADTPAPHMIPRMPAPRTKPSSVQVMRSSTARRLRAVSLTGQSSHFTGLALRSLDPWLHDDSNYFARPGCHVARSGSCGGLYQTDVQPSTALQRK
jgi:hypothetical protein